jgi:hypothetical protein
MSSWQMTTIRIRSPQKGLLLAMPVQLQLVEASCSGALEEERERAAGVCASMQ